jgi:hypothetical protein
MLESNRNNFDLWQPQAIAAQRMMRLFSMEYGSPAATMVGGALGSATGRCCPRLLTAKSAINFVVEAADFYPI